MTTPQKPMSLGERAEVQWEAFCDSNEASIQRGIKAAYLAGARGVIEEMGKVALKLESISRLDARVESPHVLANEALAILQGLIGGSHDIR
jgi:hypothetical protein